MVTTDTSSIELRVNLSGRNISSIPEMHLGLEYGLHNVRVLHESSTLVVGTGCRVVFPVDATKVSERRVLIVHKD